MKNLYVLIAYGHTILLKGNIPTDKYKQIDDIVNQLVFTYTTPQDEIEDTFINLVYSLLQIKLEPASIEHIFRKLR